MTELSLAGRARGDDIRAAVLRAGRHRRHRRQATRAGLVGVAVLVAAWIVAWGGLGPGPGRGRPTEPRTPVATELQLQHMDFAAVTTTPSTIQGWIVPPSAPPPEWFIDDSELLRLASAADRPVGIVRSGGRLLLTRDIAHHLQ